MSAEHETLSLHAIERICDHPAAGRSGIGAGAPERREQDRRCIVKPRRLKPRTITDRRRTFTFVDLGQAAIVTICPEGTGEIWIRDVRGHGFRIRTGAGPAGLGLTISRFVCGAPITLTGNADVTADVLPQRDACEVSLCQYNRDAWSQAFKQWCAGTAPHPGDAPAALVARIMPPEVCPVCLNDAHDCSACGRQTRDEIEGAS